MDAPNAVVEKVRTHEKFQESIDSGMIRLNEKMPRAASAVLAIPDATKKAALVEKFAQLGKHIERNMKAFTTSQHKAATILKELNSPKPNWLAVERTLDRALEIAARIESDVNSHELAIDDILVACRAES